MLNPKQYTALSKWKDPSASCGIFNPTEQQLFDEGFILSADQVSVDFGDFIALNHPTGYRLSPKGMYALFEFEAHRKYRTKNWWYGFLSGIAASVIANVVSRFLGL